MWAIQSNSAWARNKNTNLLGYPAIHAYDAKQNIVLCGQNLHEFFRVADGSKKLGKELGFVNCQKCLKILNRSE